MAGPNQDRLNAAALADQIEAVAPAGSTAATATHITGHFAVVTGANATKGVILPKSDIGTVITIKNITNAVLVVYPPDGDAINAAAASYSQAALTCGDYVKAGDGQWYTKPYAIA